MDNIISMIQTLIDPSLDFQVHAYLHAKEIKQFSKMCSHKMIYITFLPKPKIWHRKTVFWLSFSSIT